LAERREGGLSAKLKELRRVTPGAPTASGQKRKLARRATAQIALAQENGRAPATQPRQMLVMRGAWSYIYPATGEFMLTKSVAARLLWATVLVVGGSMAQADVLVLVDGKWVVKKTYSQTVKTAYPDVIGSPSAQKQNLNNLQKGMQYGSGILDLVNNSPAFINPYLDRSNSDAARSAAQAKAEAELIATGKKYGVVVVTAREPVNPPGGDPMLDGPYIPKVRTYDVRDPKTSDDLQDLLNNVYGRPAGINPPKDPGFFANLVIAERRPDGSVTTRVATQDDHKKYIEEQNRQAAAASEAAKAKIEKEKQQAQTAHEAAMKDAKLKEEERKKAEEKYAAEQKERDEKKRDIEARQAALEKGKKQRDELMKERDKACSSGDAESCVKANSKVNEWHATAIERHNTAMCMMDAEKGPCGPTGGGCMYCSAVDQLEKSARSNTFNALQIKTRTDLLKAGKTPGPGFEQLVQSRLSSPALIKQFGHYDFLSKGK
jgi:hypothetical protein